MRGAAVACLLAATPVAAQDITSARYLEPSSAYGHNAVADGEYALLEITLSDGARKTFRFDGAVFEDTAPRLHDFDGDGAPEVVTVVSDFETGARIQLWTAQDGQIVPAGSNAPIGQRFRWLAIAGIADFDGNGVDDIAYVDRPHLAKELVFVAVDMDATTSRWTQVSRVAGLTNHHLGAAVIEGGVRTCADQPPVVVTASADWSMIVETRFLDGSPQSQAIAPYSGVNGFAPFLRCD